MKSLALALACGTILSAGAAMADPPGRVGRISDVEGDVTFLPPGQDDWAWADRNFPVTAGESFWTDDDGRLELQAGAMEVRADNETALDVLALDYGQTRLSLTQGSVDLRLWRLPEGGVTIATPAGDVEIDAPGAYRIDVGAPQDDGSYPPVEVTVFEGEAGAPGPDGFADIQAGEAAIIYAGYDPQYADAEDAAIDDWARSREQNERWDAQDAFSPAMTGYEDLAGQGDFVSDPDYGTVWFPASVPDDWAPYRYGHWAYVNPWGYTWIDDQPWGFAPFHYGRWVRVSGRWGWTPGRPDDRPVYAPALVAFFGVGASIGWAPLAPDEVYRPTYEVSDAYLRRVNTGSVRPEVIQNVTINSTVNITQYRNAGAAVVVGADTLSRGARVQAAATRVAPEQLSAAAPVIPRAVAPPTRQALTGGETRAAAMKAAPPVAPPPRLQSLRASVAAQPPGSTRPAPIAGARIAPPPAPSPAGAPTFIAPAQRRNPELQARRPLPPPAASPRPNTASPFGQPPATRPMTRPMQRPPSASPQGTPPSSEGGQPPYGRPLYRRPSTPSQGNPPGSETAPTPTERPLYRRPPPSPQGNPPGAETAPPPSGAPRYMRPRPETPPPPEARPQAAPDYARPPVRPQESPSPRPRPEASPYRAPPPESRAPAARPENPPPEKKKKPKPDETPPPS